MNAVSETTTTGNAGHASVLASRRSRAGAGVFSAAQFNLRSALFNPFMLAFSLALPVMMYLMFGVGQDYSNVALGRGTFSGLIMVQMAFFGAINALAALGVTVAMERQQGWLRQIALTPLGAGRYAISKVLAGIALALAIIAVTYAVGWATGARLEWWVWLATAAASLGVSLVASCIGLAAAFWLRSDAAYAATSGIITLSAFISGIFLPLEQMAPIMQQLAPFTPLYGLARLPMSFVTGEAITAGVAINAAIYSAVFVVLAVWGASRRTERS